MKVRVTDWQYRNLRVGLGDQTIELGLPPKRWALVQMPNGTGKTTTMELIRAVLSERNFTEEEVREFRANDSVEEGSFELGLLIDDAHHRLTLTFDFTNGDYSYSTLRPKERGGGRESGRVLPLNLKHLLKPDFTRLFVFDGELAKQIRRVDKSEADRAIRTLYQLDELLGLRRHVERVVERHQDAAAAVSSAKSQKGLSQKRTALKEAQRVLSELEGELAQHKKREIKHIKNAKEVEDKISDQIAEDDDLKAEEKAIKSEAAAIQSELQSASSLAISAFRSPAALSEKIRSRLNDLGRTLTNARLPKSVSSEFFSELSDTNGMKATRPEFGSVRGEPSSASGRHLQCQRWTICGFVQSGWRIQGWSIATRLSLEWTPRSECFSCTG